MSRAVLLERVPILITATVAVLMYVVAGVHFPTFFKLGVGVNLFADNAALGVVAVGLTFVILTGGIDLSVGSMVGCSSIVAAALIQKSHLHPMVALGMVLVLGLGVGSGQGLLIGRLGLPPFLVTLGGLFFLRGTGLYISRESIQIDRPFFNELVDFSIPLTPKASVPIPAIVFVLIVLVGAFMAKQTRFGRSVFAIGGGKASAELMGVPVAKTLVSAYALSGFCAALGGVLGTLYTSSGNAISGTGLELDAIAAVVIGGTMLSGGFGSIFGTLLGVLILGIVQTAINFQGTLSSWWTKIVVGALLLVFMLVQRFLEQAAKGRLGGS